MAVVPLSLLSKLQPPILGAQCARCKLFEGCNSPKMEPSGQGRRRIMIVGEAPGAEEDRVGRQFVGKSGELLRRLLLKCGVDMRSDCWITNALACRPPSNEIKDAKQIEYCRPKVLDAIKEHDPNVIILLGKNAVKSVIGHLWKEDTKGIFRWAGFAIPNRRPNVWLCPSVHPSFVLHRQDKRKNYKDRGLAEAWLLMHLKSAVALAESKPWKKVPDYLPRVKVVNDLEDAARIVRSMTGAGRPVAIDYETTCLKPDGPHAKILCCAVSDGEVTASYPMLGAAREATGGLLKSGVPLIASNMSFEQRWSYKEFGHGGRGFRKGWDTMQQAHVIDNRPGIASIKFQAFIHLGQEDYDSHLSPYLKSVRKGGNEPNRIKDIDWNDLLTYCGYDALLEWEVAHRQVEVLGVDFP